MATAVTVEGLAKSFGETKALVDIDLEVPEGTVVGLLGPNGAGKTTVVRILATLLRADAGRAEVFGVDVATQPDRIRPMIGLTGQYAAVDEYLTGFENLEMIGRLFGMPRLEVRRRADELLEQFDLTAARNRPAKTYSGGMRRRLDISASLIARPRVLFLDEPTTGLDPRSRLGMWDVVEQLVADGTTILLTTQYLDEADRLADSITVIDHGRVIARGTADELKSQVGGERLVVVVADEGQLEAARGVLEPLGVDKCVVNASARQVTVPITGGMPVLRRAIDALADTDVTVLDIGLRRPDLDDVFLTLTGRPAEEAPADAEDTEGGDPGRRRGGTDQTSTENLTRTEAGR